MHSNLPMPEHGASSDAPGASVLVVEDDPRGARLLAAHLQTAGYRASVAHSADEALAAVEAALPDLILCDVCLPGMDGIELTRLLRGQPGAADLPIALITSSDDSKILARGLEAGADDFLSKPVNALELRTRVRSLLRSKLLADELRARGRAIMPLAGDFKSTEPPADPDGRNGRPLAVVVEDSAQDRRLLEAYLTEFGFTCRHADSAAAGTRLLGECRPDLVVLDLLLPDCSGYEFIAALKSNPACSQVPILVVSAMADVQDRVKALEVGADDFIVKGFERLEFEARSRRLLRLKRSLDHLNSRCDQAMRLAVTDSLTGLYTQGFMRETLDTQLRSAERYRTSYSAIFADIDHFKQVNDRHGHAAGDTVLQAVASALRGLVRQSDTLVRYGGEEFVALLPHTDGAEAMVLAERMRSAVAAIAIPIDDGDAIRVTMSLGVASFPDDATDGETLVQRGDAAMYLAKQTGRNRTVAAGAGAGSSDARVLLVDDDEKNLRLLEAYLLPEGYRLLRARDGHEAIEVCRAQQPDIVIMDAMMPRLSGYDACRRLKQDAKARWLPVMLVTRPGARDDKRRGLEAGADEFIAKPVDRIELLTRMRALVDHKRDMDSLEGAELVVFALARAVEEHDPLSGNHMERVADYAIALARAAGLSEREQKAVWKAGRVHDIGKIVIPDAVLFKPGPLTAEEFKLVREHPDKGFQLLAPLPTFADALPAIRFHHERLDGSGYPLGLRGDEVPRLAQILAIADVFDALTGERHYRPAIRPAEAIDVLRDEAGRGLHDPRLVETFVAQMAGGTAAPPGAADGRVPAECLAGG